MDRPPTASQLLNVWEQARSQRQVQRALALLALAAPTQSVAELARYSIGRRDQELLGLREKIFGSDLTGAAQCPACGETIELRFSVADIRAEIARDPDQLHVLQSTSYEVSFRLPNSGDLAQLDPGEDLPSQKSALLRRCLAGVRVNGQLSATDPLPDTVADAVSRRMAELDPQGDTQLTLTCPACGHLWVSPLDIVSYLWQEIHAWAGRMLRDVHELALTYGWSEAEILALSPSRRQAYLEIIRQ